MSHLAQRRMRRTGLTKQRCSLLAAFSELSNWATSMLWRVLYTLMFHATPWVKLYISVVKKEICIMSLSVNPAGLRGSTCVMLLYGQVQSSQCSRQQFNPLRYVSPALSAADNGNPRQSKDLEYCLQRSLATIGSPLDPLVCQGRCT